MSLFLFPCFNLLVFSKPDTLCWACQLTLDGTHLANHKVVTVKQSKPEFLLCRPFSLERMFMAISIFYSCSESRPMKGPHTGTTIRAWATVKILWKELYGLNRPHRLLLLLPSHSTHIGPSVAQVLSLGPPYGQKALKACLPLSLPSGVQHAIIKTRGASWL